MKTKLIQWMMAAILICGATVFTSCSSSEDNPINNNDGTQVQNAKYTIMIYGCGGRNVDVQIDDAIGYIAKALKVSNNQVRVTVMYSMSKDISAHKAEDPKTTENDFRGEFGKTYRYELTSDIDTTLNGFRSKYFYKNASEVELYKKSTLVEYINWAKQTAPADNYILMPANHGGGFDLDHEVTRGILYDDNHENICLSIRTIAAALKETGGVKAIYWYGCMMGQIEVLTEVAPYCEYQFASSHVARVNHLHITGLIDAINASPDNFEAAIAMQHKTIEAVNEDFCNVPEKKDSTIKHNENCDFGCWRSDKLAAINSQVKELASLLADNYATDSADINKATTSVYLFEKEEAYVDLIDFANLVAGKLTNTQLKTQAQTIASTMKTAFDAATVYRFNGVNLMSEDGYYVAPENSEGKNEYSIGISIYAKNEDTYMLYGANGRGSAFEADTGWYKWLNVNMIQVTDSGVNPSNNSSWETFWLEEASGNDM
jgi:hypothetical protein